MKNNIPLTINELNCKMNPNLLKNGTSEPTTTKKQKGGGRFLAAILVLKQEVYT